MKTEYWTKQKLYEEVDKLKCELGLELTADIYPINSKELGKKKAKI